MLKPSVNFWNARVPLKIKIFLWQVDNDRLQSAITLKHRGWQGSHLCCLCQQPETTNHILFGCSMARFLWKGVGETLGWIGQPKFWGDFLTTWISRNCKIPKRFSFLIVASLTWTLWTTRNKMAIEHVLPTNATQTFHVFIGFMQRWIPLSRAADREKAREIVERLKTWVMGFHPTTYPVSDIGHI